MFSNRNLFNSFKKFLFIKLSMKKIVLEEFDNNSQNNELQRGLLLDSQPKTKKPSMYNVLLLNKKQEEATQIMLHVHQNGIGVCGTFTYEVAESKCKSVMDMAKKNEHPLQSAMEKS